MTVRSDLEYLERQGRVSRTHGGAVPADAALSNDEFEIRLGVHREAKQRIAAAAVRLISSSEAVILDSGTTVHHLAQAITGVSALTVYTPALPAAQHLMRTDGVDVHFLGGRIIPSWLQTVGTARQLGIKDLIADALSWAPTASTTTWTLSSPTANWSRPSNASFDGHAASSCWSTQANGPHAAGSRCTTWPTLTLSSPTPCRRAMFKTTWPPRSSSSSLEKAVSVTTAAATMRTTNDPLHD